MILDLDKLKALEAKATKGPWHFSPGDYETGLCNEVIQYEEASLPEIFTIDRGEYYGLDNENGALIAEMRNALPDLIATIERYEAALRFYAGLGTKSGELGERAREVMGDRK